LSSGRKRADGKTHTSIQIAMHVDSASRCPGTTNVSNNTLERNMEAVAIQLALFNCCKSLPTDAYDAVAMVSSMENKNVPIASGEICK